LALLIWLNENVRLRAPFLAMAELKQAWFCSSGLTKRSEKETYMEDPWSVQSSSRAILSYGKEDASDHNLDTPSNFHIGRHDIHLFPFNFASLNDRGF
jgi:hypothetical protein